MSIADKLTTIAENVPKVYESGKNAIRTDLEPVNEALEGVLYGTGEKTPIVDESKIIPKTVTGKRFISVDDVSEVRHSVEIDISSDCGISVCGKNLLNPVFDTQLFVSVAIGSAIVKDTGGYSVIVKVTPNTKYTISGVCTGMNGNTVRIAYTENYPDVGIVTVGAREQMVASEYKTFTFTTPSSCNYVLLMTGTSTVYDYTNNELQVEQGEYATTYVPYIKPTQYATQNSSAIIPSLSPYMTVIADSDVDITMNYRKSYGIQTEYDRFWDYYQENGNRTNYMFGFAGKGWTNKTFEPKYPVITPSIAYGMFWQSGIVGDLEKLCEEKGAELDFSKCSSMNYCFSQNLITKVGVVDVTNAEALLLQVFGYNVSIETIGLFKIRENQSFSGVFHNCTALKNINIEGTIGNNFDIRYSPLTHESIMSIINHLQTKTSGTFTLTLGSTNLAKLTDAEKAIATEKGWTLA